MVLQLLEPKKPKKVVRWTRRKYKRYLRSDWWRKKRLEKMASQNYLCERCGDWAAEVHHKHYDSLGAEVLSDLEALCRTCHKKEHGIRRSR